MLTHLLSARRALQNLEGVALQLDFLARGQHQPVPAAQAHRPLHGAHDAYEARPRPVVAGDAHNLRGWVRRVVGQVVGGRRGASIAGSTDVR